MINSRVAVAVHLLALLALGKQRAPGVPFTSEIGAESVNTNPVVVRRILGALRKAGIVSSQPGPAGGWFLERPPQAITLRDIYAAVEDECLFSLHHRQPNHACPIGGHIQEALACVFVEAERAMTDELAQKTIADVVHAVLLRSGERMVSRES